MRFFDARGISGNLIAGLLICFAMAVCAELAASDENSAMAFVNAYCIDCHMEGSAEAGIAFDPFPSDEEFFRAGKPLLRALDVVEQGLMPPTDALQPSGEERTAFVETIKSHLSQSDCSSEGPSPPVVIRRLNRQEYNNTLRDLLGIQLDLSQDFPPDDSGFGYDNIGSALNTSPVHVERYLQAAEKALAVAVKTPDASEYPPVELIGLRTYPLAPDGQVDFEHHLAPGRYQVHFSLVRAGIPETAPTPLVVVGFGKDRRTIAANKVQDETVVYRFWLNVFEGDEQVSVRLSQDSVAQQAPKPTKAGNNVSGDKRYGDNHGLHVDSMVVHGPVPVPSNSEFQNAQPWIGDEQRETSGRSAVSQFASAAFRRPARSDEVSRLMQLFRQAHRQGESFEHAMQITMTAVLVSPQFLFLVEPESSELDRPLTEYELASRLSYFLWSSMPDEDLLKAAAAGTVRENLRMQVSRMLADSKSDAFVENFVGQWLQLRNLNSVSPDPDLFPDFDESLTLAMRAETEAFFAHVLRQNRSVLELLDSDYTFLNERLAKHYGIEGIQGPEIRMVSFDSRDEADKISTRSQRGGVLTHASVLTLTSHHNRTSPVKRGQWILQQILGTPPPPPPPDVAELNESREAAQASSLRERMEIHRASPECASCHSQMDPLGFGLENFDAVGRWRDFDGLFRVDSTGVLPGNREFDGAAEMKALLKDSASRKFSWCLIENLLTYGLGRSLEPADYCTVETIRTRLVEHDFQIQEILFAIVESRAFLNRGVSR